MADRTYDVIITTRIVDSTATGAQSTKSSVDRMVEQSQNQFRQAAEERARLQDAAASKEQAILRATIVAAGRAAEERARLQDNAAQQAKQSATQTAAEQARIRDQELRDIQKIHAEKQRMIDKDAADQIKAAQQDLREVQKIHAEKVKLAAQEAAAKKAADDKYTRQALADIKRMEVERARIVAENNKAIEKSDQQAYNQRIKLAKQSATQLAGSLSPQGGAAGGGEGGGAVNSLLTGALGGAAAGAVIVGFKELISVGREFFGLISEGAHWVIELTNDLAKHGEELYRLQQKTKLSAEAASVYNIIAKETGVELAQLGVVAARLESKIDRGVTEPFGEAGRALKTLGIDAKELEKLAPQDAVNLVAKSIDNLQNQYVKAHVAQSLTGRGFAEAAPALHALAVSYDLAREKGERFGLLFSQEGIDRAHQYSVAAADLSLAWDGFKHTIAEEAVPAMINAFVSLSNFIADNNSKWKALGEAIGTTIEVTRVLIAMLPGLGKALAGSAVVAPITIFNGVTEANAAAKAMLEQLQLEKQQAETDLKTIESLRERAKQKGGADFLRSELSRIATEKKAIKDRMNSWADTAIPDNIAKQSLADANKYADQIRAVMAGIPGTEEFAPGKEKTQKAFSELQTLQKEYTKLTAEVLSLYRAGSQEFKLRFKVEDLRQAKSDLDGILKLRHQLGLPLDAPLPHGLEAIKEETRLRTEQKKIVDSVTTAKYAQSDAEYKLASLMLTQNIPLANEEVRANTKIAQSLHDRRNAEIELTADLRAAVKERENALTGEQTTLRDTRQAYVQMQLDAVKASETTRMESLKARLQLAINTGAEPAVKQGLEIALKSEAETLKPPLVSMNERIGTIIGQLTSILETMAHPPTVGSGSSMTTTGAWNFAQSAAQVRDWFQQTFGKALPVHVYGLDAGHKAMGFKYHDALDVALSPNSAEGRALAAYLRSQGMPFSSFAGPARNAAGQVISTGTHFHIGPPGSRTRSGPISDMFTDTTQPLEAGTFQYETGRKFAHPQSGRQGRTPPVLQPGPGSPGYNADRINTTTNQSVVDVADEQAFNRTTAAYTARVSEINNLVKSTLDVRAADQAYAATEGKTLSEVQALADAQAKKRAGETDEAAELALLNKFRGMTIEQIRVQNAVELDGNARRDAVTKATTAQGVAENNLYLARGDTEYVTQLLTLAESARAASAEKTENSIIESEGLLKKLRRGDEEELRRLASSAKDARIKGQTSLFQTVATLEDQIAHAGEDSAMRVKVAKLTALRSVQDADQAAAESMIASQIHLADAITFHPIQAQAQMLTYLEQQKTVTVTVVDSMKAAYDKLTVSVDNSLGKMLHGLGAIKDVIITIVNQLLSSVFQQFMRVFLGSGSSSQQGGGLFGGLFGGGGGVGSSSFAGGSGGIGALASFLPGLTGGGMGSPASLTGSNNLSQMLKQGLGIGVGDVTKLPGAASAGLLASLGGMLPLLGLTAGVGLGASLGAPSRFGGVLGALGGGLAGIGAGAAGFFALGGTVSAGFMGTALGLLSNPFTIAAGAALLIGAVILGKKAQRDKDEKTRAAAQAQADTSLFSILAAVKTDQMDGPTATAAIAKLHDDWIATGNAMKDSKTRNIHLAAWRDFQPIIDAINKEIAGQAGRANARLRMAPVFASGGYNATDQFIKVRPGEGIQYPGTRSVQTIPGRDMGYDSQYMYAPAGTRIIPNSQMRNPEYHSHGGTVGDSGGSNTPAIAPNISVSIDIDRDALATVILKSPLFKTQVIRNVQLGIKERRI